MLLRVMAFIELLLYLWTCPNLITLFNLQKKKKNSVACWYLSPFRKRKSEVYVSKKAQDP